MNKNQSQHSSSSGKNSGLEEVRPVTLCAISGAVGRKPIKQASTPEQANGIGFPRQSCLNFFCKAKSKSIPISGPTLQNNALVFAEELEIDNFQASNGWLTNWKSRFIKQLIISGESTDVDPEVVAKLKDSCGGSSPMSF